MGTFTPDYFRESPRHSMRESRWKAVLCKAWTGSLTEGGRADTGKTAKSLSLAMWEDWRSYRQ